MIRRTFVTLTAVLALGWGSTQALAERQEIPDTNLQYGAFTARFSPEGTFRLEGEGVYAYDMAGKPLWQVDIGRVDMGAYDVPSYEWGPASSPVIHEDLVILQVDTQADSFLLALNAATGETVWKTERDELPSWGTPTVISTPGGEEIVTNASKFIRGYDPRTGEELWRLGGSSKITAPTPFGAGGLVFVASGRAPERPIFAIRPGGSGRSHAAEGPGEQPGGRLEQDRTGIVHAHAACLRRHPLRSREQRRS